MPQNSAFIFREYDLNQQKRQELAEKIFAICQEKSCKFLIGKDLELARKIEADGVHFSDLDFVDGFDNASVVAGFARKFTISLSCHSLQSVQKAQNSGADVIFLSPIFATKSHANAKTLDLENLAEACKSSTKPIFALGGISEKNLASIAKCGARGFGGIEIFTR